jgi:type I restriction enzyme S subunit
MSEWKEYKLEDVCDAIYSGGTPSSMVKDYWNGSLPWLSSGETNQRYIFSTEKCITQEGVDNSSTRYAYKDSTVVASAGQGHTRGQASLLCINTYVNQSVIVLKPNEKCLNPYFLYYNIDNRYNELRQLSDGTSTRGSLSGKILKELPIKIPSLVIQSKIASILKSFDDKIEVNKRISDNLEQQAQALFKHWFVDFAPFKDGKFVESELGLIPEGWRVGTLGDLVEIIDNRGKTPPLCSESIYPIIDVKTLTGEGRIVSYEKCSKFVNQDTYNNWFRSGHPQKGDILLSTVGSLAEMKIFMGGLGCIAQNVVALRNPQKSLYLYDYLNWIKKDLLSYNIGSVQPSIKVTHIIKHKVLIPDQNILLRYQDIVKEITEKSYSNNAEITLLSNIRDNLLPKLMSGQIKV